MSKSAPAPSGKPAATPAPSEAKLYAAAPTAKDNAKSAFNQARDGKQVERQGLTPAQKNSAAKLAEVNKRSPSGLKRMSLKSAASRVEFNNQARGARTEQSTQQPKRTAQDIRKVKVATTRSYQSKRTGITYTAGPAMKAARNLDRSASKAKTKEVQKVTTSHHAPAPSPSWAPAAPKRGRSQEQAKPELSKADQARYDYAVKVAGRAKTNEAAKELGQDKSRHQDQGMGL